MILDNDAPHLFPQMELNDLVRDLGLSKSSGLKENNSPQTVLASPSTATDMKSISVPPSTRALCMWDSRDRAQHYTKKDWPLWEKLVPFCDIICICFFNVQSVEHFVDIHYILYLRYLSTEINSHTLVVVVYPLP